MRPTGALHLGHYHGALKNWVRLQDDYDCFFFVADWHALTTHYEEREVIEQQRLRHGDRLARRRPRPGARDDLHPEPPARARRAVHAARDGHAARLARAHADLQGPDREAEGPRPRDLRLPRLPAAAGGRHPDLQGAPFVPVGEDQALARRDHARGRAPLQPPLRPRAATSRRSVAARAEEARRRTTRRHFEAARKAFREDGDAAALGDGARADRRAAAALSAASDRELLPATCAAPAERSCPSRRRCTPRSRSCPASTARR